MGGEDVGEHEPADVSKKPDGLQAVHVEAVQFAQFAIEPVNQSQLYWRFSNTISNSLRRRRPGLQWQRWQ